MAGAAVEKILCWILVEFVAIHGDAFGIDVPNGWDAFFAALPDAEDFPRAATAAGRGLVISSV